VSEVVKKNNLTPTLSFGGEGVKIKTVASFSHKGERIQE
jgi:hypothetical protein